MLKILMHYYLALDSSQSLIADLRLMEDKRVEVGAAVSYTQIHNMEDMVQNMVNYTDKLEVKILPNY